MRARDGGDRSGDDRNSPGDGTGGVHDGSADDGAHTGDGTDSSPPDPNPGPKTEKSYPIDSTEAFLNPERGFHGDVTLTSSNPNFNNVRNNGYTLVRSYVRLDDYRNGPIAESLLTNLRNSLAKLRSAGIKATPRFSYNFGSAPDAPLNIVQQHIDQLKPILTEYSDVIAVLQAGFIGAWGEWHSSTNNLTTAANKKTIGEALLKALPDSRMIQVRAPFHRRDIVGAPSQQADVFSASNEARIGFLNDCFLSSDNDAGTYAGDQKKDRNEAKDFSGYTVTGGETCAIGYGTARQKCDVALKELAEFHWDYLNSDYYAAILNGWKSEGCFDEINRRLGYRIGIESAAATTSVEVGGVVTVDLKARNDGFGKVYNPRPIDLVLRDAAGGAATVVRATEDSRKMLPLAGESRDLELSIRLPQDLKPGTYNLLLSLPDASSHLEKDVRYNIRLANVGTWEADTGLNDLGLTVKVGP